MRDLVKRALTRKVTLKASRGKQRTLEIEPSEKLVLGVKFAIGMTICLSALEITHMAFLGTWSSEIFSAVSGLIGTITGVLIGQHA